MFINVSEYKDIKKYIESKKHNNINLQSKLINTSD